MPVKLKTKPKKAAPKKPDIFFAVVDKKTGKTFVSGCSARPLVYKLKKDAMRFVTSGAGLKVVKVKLVAVK